MEAFQKEGIVLSADGIKALLQNRKILQSNMKAIGIMRPEGIATNLHHIVVKGAAGAEKSRAVFEKLGVSVENALNGVYIPTEYHQHIHTKNYYDKLYNNYLRNVPLDQENRFWSFIGGA